MPLPRSLDPTDLVILRAIAEKPEIRTREVEAQAYLSRTQVLRRLHRLEQENWIAKKNGGSKAYHYTLNPDVDVEQLHQNLNMYEDSVAREAIRILVQGLEVFSNQLAEFSNQLAQLASRVETILK
jgi:DNA-binding MarR family transcriptional regulator